MWFTQSKGGREKHLFAVIPILVFEQTTGHQNLANQIHCIGHHKSHEPQRADFIITSSNLDLDHSNLDAALEARTS